MDSEEVVTRQMQQTVQYCTDCHIITLDTVTYMLDKGGSFAQPSRVATLLDCAEMCQTTANFLLRGSDLSGRVCGACADVCDYCADLCEQFGGDPQMQTCADACRRCAAACREVAALMA